MCGTKIIKGVIAPEKVLRDHTEVELIFHSTVLNYVFNPYMLDSLNIAIEQTGIKFVTKNIVANYIESGVMLSDARNKYKIEQWITDQSNTENKINIYVLLTGNNLQGYVPVPSDLEYLLTDQYNSVFVYWGFDWRTLAHEIGHFYLLNHNMSHCRLLMGYGSCSSVFTSKEIESIINARFYRAKFEN